MGVHASSPTHMTWVVARRTPREVGTMSTGICWARTRRRTPSPSQRQLVEVLAGAPGRGLSHPQRGAGGAAAVRAGRTSSPSSPAAFPLTHVPPTPPSPPLTPLLAPRGRGMPGMQMPPQVLARTGEERSLLQTWRWRRLGGGGEGDGGWSQPPRLWDEGGSPCRDRNRSGGQPLSRGVWHVLDT